MSPPKRLKKQEAREALPEELRGTFDMDANFFDWGLGWPDTTYFLRLSPGWLQKRPTLIGRSWLQRLGMAGERIALSLLRERRRGQAVAAIVAVGEVAPHPRLASRGDRRILWLLGAGLEEAMAAKAR